MALTAICQRGACEPAALTGVALCFTSRNMSLLLGCNKQVLSLTDICWSLCIH